MKGIIIYFSGTGNTKYAAELFSKEFESAGCKMEMHSVEENYKIIPDSYDFLILGCPKYCEYPVLSFVKYIKQNIPPSQKRIKTIMFVTQAGPLGTDFKGISKILNSKNHELVSSKSIVVANNFLIMKSFKETSDEVINKNDGILRKQIHEMVQNFLDGKYENEIINPFLSGLNKSVAFIFDKMTSGFVKKYSVSDDCVKCGLCVKMCPNKNIRLNEDRIEFGKNCMLCMRCMNICPKNAILYNTKKIPQYRKHIDLIK